MDRAKGNSIEVETILRDIAISLNINYDEIKIDSSSDYFQEWDSMGTINLITSLEEKYSCKFDLLEIPLFNNVKSILKLLEKKGFNIKYGA
jgi:acyl carrier protein